MTVDENGEYLLVGAVGSTYGIKGWLKIISYTATIPKILEYNPWYIEDRDGWKLYKVEEGKIHGKGIIAKLNGYNNPETAKLLSGKKISILRSQLPLLKKDEYYWSQLKGLTVIDQHGENLGKVIYLLETGSNDVLVVKGTKEHAIPYLPGEVVTEVNLEKGEVHVNWEVI